MPIESAERMQAYQSIKIGLERLDRWQHTADERQRALSMLQKVNSMYARDNSDIVLQSADAKEIRNLVGLYDGWLWNMDDRNTCWTAQKAADLLLQKPKQYARANNFSNANPSEMNGGMHGTGTICPVTGGAHEFVSKQMRGSMISNQGSSSNTGLFDQRSNQFSANAHMGGQASQSQSNGYSGSVSGGGCGVTAALSGGANMASSMAGAASGGGAFSSANSRQSQIDSAQMGQRYRNAEGDITWGMVCRKCGHVAKITAGD